MFWGYGPPPLPVKHGKGQPSKLHKEELLKRRDGLVHWLEQNWPYLSVALRKARNSQDALAAIKAAQTRNPHVLPVPFYQSPERHEEALWGFLQSDRFHENPRSLAAALSGLPELSCKRAFDICSAHPSKLPLTVEAYWDYLRRNFPDRWRELRAAKTLEQVRAVLKKSRTQDTLYLRLKKHSKDHPEEVFEWFNAGNPSMRLQDRRQIVVLK